MMIRLKCLNENCEYSYEVSEAEIKEYGEYHKKCLICGSELRVTKESIKEIVKKDLEIEIKKNVDTYFKNLGIEYTIEMIERNKELAIKRLYVAEIRKRGFKIKGE